MRHVQMVLFTLYNHIRYVDSPCLKKLLIIKLIEIFAWIRIFKYLKSEYFIGFIHRRTHVCKTPYMSQTGYFLDFSMLRTVWMVTIQGITNNSPCFLTAQQAVLRQKTFRLINLWPSLEVIAKKLPDGLTETKPHHITKYILLWKTFLAAWRWTY